MPILVPAVRGTSQQILYPFTRSVEFVTEVASSVNCAEQRFVTRPPLYRFELPYSDLLWADVVSQADFFEGAKGMFDRTVQLTLDSVLYGNLTLEQDSFDAITKQPLTWDTMIKLRQTQNGAWTPPTAPTAYPTLANGTRAQYPLTNSLRFLTWMNDQPTGPRYALSSIGGAFTNFPSAALASWTMEYPLLTETDLATIEAFFLACQGRYCSFTFTDPVGGGSFTNCRLDQDTLEIKYNGPHGPAGHQVSTTLKVTQFFIPSPPV